MTPSELFLARRFYPWSTLISIFCGVALSRAFVLVQDEHFVWGGVCAGLSGLLFLTSVQAIKLRWLGWKERAKSRCNQGER